METELKPYLINEDNLNEIKCPTDSGLICSRLLLTHNQYSLKLRKSDEILKSMEKDKDKFKAYFEDLLKSIITIIEPTILISKLFKNYLCEIKEITYGYESIKENTVSFYLFLESDNWDVEEQIYNIYGNILEQFPDKEIDINLFRLWDRDPESLLPNGYIKW